MKTIDIYNLSFDTFPLYAGVVDNKLYFLTFKHDLITQYCIDAKTQPGTDTAWMTRLQEWIDSFAAKTFNVTTIAETWFLPVGTPLQQRVWATLCTIPYGETVTYSQLATMIEKPLAVRAVASCVGANKINLLIPCHRAVAKNGTINYNGGPEVKKWLLENKY